MHIHIVHQNQIQSSRFNPRMLHHPDNLIQIVVGAGAIGGAEIVSGIEAQTWD